MSETKPTSPPGAANMATAPQTISAKSIDKATKPSAQAKSPEEATKSRNRPVNPYVLRRSELEQTRITNFPEFISTVDTYIQTILRHDPSLRKQKWYATWSQWVDDDIMAASNSHMITVIIDYPTDSPDWPDKSYKSVGRYILQQLPILKGYMSIPPQTRLNDPVLKLTAPYLVENEPFQTVVLPENKTGKISTSQDDTSNITLPSGLTQTKTPTKISNSFSVLADDESDDDTNNNPTNTDAAAFEDLEEIAELYDNNNNTDKTHNSPTLLNSSGNDDDLYNKNTASIIPDHRQKKDMMNAKTQVTNIPEHTSENTSATLITDMVSVTNAFEKEYQDISTIFTNDQKDNMNNYLSKYWDRKTAEFDNYVGEQLNTIRQNQNTFELFIATKERELDQKFQNLSTNHKTMETKLNDELA